MIKNRFEFQGALNDYLIDIEGWQKNCISYFLKTLESRLNLSSSILIDPYIGKARILNPFGFADDEQKYFIINVAESKSIDFANKDGGRYLYTRHEGSATIGHSTSKAATKIGNTLINRFEADFHKERGVYLKYIIFDNLISDLGDDILAKIRHDSDLSDISRRTAKRLFDLYRLSIRACFYYFAKNLDQGVVETMLQTQFIGTVYYNWLLGAPCAHEPGVVFNSMPPPEPEIAKFRQKWAKDHPQAANILAHVLTFNQSSLTTNDRLNDEFFSHEAVYGMAFDGALLEDRLLTFIGRGIHKALLTPDKMSPHILNPRFWRGAEDDFNGILQGYIEKDTGRMPEGKSFIEPLANMMHVQIRMRTHRPRLIPGGI